MADFNMDLKQKLSPEVLQRTVLLGRVKMAQAIKMPETEWAKLISEIEKDPLFREMMGTRSVGAKIVHYKRFDRSGISSQFYEMQESRIAGGGGETPEALLLKKKHLLKLIERIGQENFEKYFLYREDAESLENISNQCATSKADSNAMPTGSIAPTPTPPCPSQAQASPAPLTSI